MKNHKKFVASVSHGKDSQMMLLVILRHPEKYPLDCVVFVNTGMEYQSVYTVRDQTKALLGDYGIPYYELDVSDVFIDSMLHKEIHKRSGEEQYGFGWCGGPCRWFTSIKLTTLQKFYKSHFPECDIVEYVGLAADEKHRCNKEAMEKGTKVYPLIEEGYTEADSLAACYRYGFTWEENGYRLYDYMDRVSCYCCRNKNLKELRFMYHRMPDYWTKLEKMQQIIKEPYRGDADIHALAERFKREGDRLNIFDVCFP